MQCGLTSLSPGLPPSPWTTPQSPSEHQLLFSIPPSSQHTFNTAVASGVVVLHWRVCFQPGEHICCSKSPCLMVSRATLRCIIGFPKSTCCKFYSPLLLYSCSYYPSELIPPSNPLPSQKPSSHSRVCPLPPSTSNLSPWMIDSIFWRFPTGPYSLFAIALL